MLKTRVVFAMTVTLGLGTYASGQDVTEIDECKTIDAPGSYLLEKDLAATGDCLVVTSDFVTIDLGGFTISGDGAEADFEDPGALSLGPFGTGSGISTPSFQKGVTVRNGQITGFNVGIDLGTGGAHVVEGVRVFANSFIGIRAGRASLIKDNLSLFNGYEGEFTIEGSAGIDLDCPSVVTGNVIQDNFITKFMGFETSPDSAKVDLRLRNNDVGPCVVVENTFTPGFTP